jgi:hybrid cluster-associated redox disulfide protein
MDRATRSFIVASLAYLAVGGVLGVLIGVVPDLQGHLLFAHVHVLLGGFMAMMIFGVGYFILPRFAARSLRWPSLVAVHFWLANVSLVTMVISRPLASALSSPAWMGVFHLAALIQGISLLLFVVNLAWTLVGPPRRTESTKTSAETGSAGLRVVGQGATAPAGPGPNTPVGEIVDRKEGALDILVSAGLKPLADPQHLDMVRRAEVPLATACSKHGIDLDEILARVRALPDRAHPEGAGLTPDDVIGKVVERYPATREVFRQRFGEGCFTCPGFPTETLAQGALMHGVDVQELIAELERVVGRRG